jgi:hypothetical protein
MWRILERTKANSFEDESIQRRDWLNSDQASPDRFKLHMLVCKSLRYDFADDGPQRHAQIMTFAVKALLGH